MNLKRLLLGPQKEDLLGKSVVQLAVDYALGQDNQILVVGLLAAAVLLGGGIWVLFWHGDESRVFPFAFLFLSVLAIIAARAAVMMPVMQMIQTQDQARESTHLASAIEELINELRLQRDAQRHLPTPREQKP